MNVGLPGTGIGGLFYLLSALLILIAEILLTMKGRSSKKRWKIVVEEAGIALLMITTAVGTNYILSLYLFKKHPLSPPASSNITLNSIYLLQSHPILVPIIILVIVLIIVQILNLSLTYRSSK